MVSGVPSPDPTAERVARNNAIFREANEGISGAARDYGLDKRVPFICECADPACTAIIQVELNDYERIRANATWFLDATDHYRSSQGYADVVERRDGYDVVEKRGEAGELAAELDPRTD
jgi:hypothetical protein